MAAGKMHADEVDIDVSVVRRLLAVQFPRWADLPVEPVASAGPLPAADMRQAAIALAQFVVTLRRIDPTGGPHNFFR
jgi:aminoglycoside phosphotransferase (APT) family kinase protein